MWYLQVFEKVADGWVRNAPTAGIDAELVRRTWALADDDPVVGACYPVAAEHVAILREHTDEPLDLDHFDYFLAEENEPAPPGWHSTPSLEQLRAVFGEDLVPAKPKTRRMFP